jgi:hypothetical protein
MVWPRARPNVLHPRQYGGINLLKGPIMGVKYSCYKKCYIKYI